MARPIDNYDPRTESTSPVIAKGHDPQRPRYPVYLSWRARTRDGRILDFGRVYDCPTWQEAQMKARELERMVRDPNALFPSVEAFEVDVDPGVPESARRQTAAGSQAAAELAAVLKHRGGGPSPDEEF